MKNINPQHMVYIQRTLEHLKPSTEELTAVRKLEKKGKNAEFAAALLKLDKKYDHMVLKTSSSIDRKWKKPALKPANFLPSPPPTTPPTTPNRTLGQFSRWLTGQSDECSCVLPFGYQGLDVFGSITGPPTSEVRAGILGAGKYYDGEYTLTNLGDTEGTTRVPLDGQLNIVFSGSVQEGGSYDLLMPTGDLDIFGSTRVVGHGNMTTCYDSKVSIRVTHFLFLGSECKEVASWDIQSDGTRSEDRQKEFANSITYEQRYVHFTASGPLEVALYIILLAHTEANEDGKAWVYVEHFGFPAVLKTDLDTLIAKTS